jgi:hypothetical protein
LRQLQPARCDINAETLLSVYPLVTVILTCLFISVPGNFHHVSRKASHFP